MNYNDHRNSVTSTLLRLSCNKRELIRLTYWVSQFTCSSLLKEWKNLVCSIVVSRCLFVERIGKKEPKGSGVILVKVGVVSEWVVRCKLVIVFGGRFGR